MFQKKLFFLFGPAFPTPLLPLIGCATTKKNVLLLDIDLKIQSLLELSILAKECWIHQQHCDLNPFI